MGRLGRWVKGGGERQKIRKAREQGGATCADSSGLEAAAQDCRALSGDHLQSISVGSKLLCSSMLATLGRSKKCGSWGLPCAPVAGLHRQYVPFRSALLGLPDILANGYISF